MADTSGQGATGARVVSASPLPPPIYVQSPFRPVPVSTVSVQVGDVATAAGKLPLAGGRPVKATSFRVRNDVTSASPVTLIVSADPNAIPVIPAPFAKDGTGGKVGDATIDPGSVEVFTLSPTQQTALAAGKLFLSAITPAGGSAVLSVTPGIGG